MFLLARFDVCKTYVKGSYFSKVSDFFPKTFAKTNSVTGIFQGFYLEKFYWEESCSEVDLTLLQKSVSYAAARRSEVYPGLPHLSKMESFAVVINGFCSQLLFQISQS